MGARAYPGGAGALLLAAVLVPGAAWADDPFIDTRVLARHAGQTLPDLLPYENALAGKTTFLYRREALPFSEFGYDTVANAAQPVHAMAGVSEGSTAIQALRLRGAGDGWMAAAAERGEQGHAYRDGAGTKLNFGYQRNTQWMGAKVGKPEDTQFSIGFSRDVLEGAKLLNYGLDLDYMDQGGGRAAVETRALPGWFNQMGGMAAFFYAHVDADNYTLRGPISARIYADGQHQGVRANGWAAHDAGPWRTLFGTEVAHQTHSATRYGHNYGPNAVTGYWIPDVELMRASAWAEQTWRGVETTLQAGLRYDAVSMSANDLHKRGTSPVALFNSSAQELYDQYYGAGTDNDSLDHNVSGRLRAEHKLGGDALGFLDLARLVRSPDHAERYSGNGGPASMVEVGNPSLRPEVHYKTQLGSTVSGGGHRGYGRPSPAGAWRFEGSGWFDNVDDFVTIDTARGQSGVAATNGGQVYRNVDATLAGVSADGQYNLTDNFALRLYVTGQRGRNLTDGRPLYQIAPLEALLFADFFGGDDDLGWNLGSRVRAVAGKRAVDSNSATGSGMDTAGPAGGFAVFDVYGGVNVGTNLAVTLGVDNVFDKLYREHIKTTPNTSTGVMPNAPGRTLVLRALVSF